MADANGYRVLQEGRATHVNPGNADDWLYATLGTAPFTFEVGLDFNSQNANSIGAVVRNNVEPALRGSEMALGLRNWRFVKGLVTPAALIAVAAGCAPLHLEIGDRRIPRPRGLLLPRLGHAHRPRN